MTNLLEKVTSIIRNLNKTLCLVIYQPVVSRGIKIDEAIKNCGNLSNKFVEISAPHPYETIDNLKKNFSKIYKRGIFFHIS